MFSDSESVQTEGLCRLCFDRAGSLFAEDGEIRIMTCLSRGLILNKRYALVDVPRASLGIIEHALSKRLN